MMLSGYRGAYGGELVISCFYGEFLLTFSSFNLLLMKLIEEENVLKIIYKL